MDPREVRVFISSTFRDMHAEREVLVKRVAPALRAIAAGRRLGFFEVDLRWGITEEQAARGEVLPICLEEISRCRPYFIGLLGERYGWVPKSVPETLLRELPWLEQRRQASVTELEIVHGVLADPGMASRALFYFRDPAWIDTLPPEAQADFRAESPEAARRLAARNDPLRARGQPGREGYRSPEELGDRVLADLTAAMDRDYPQSAAPDALEAQDLDHEAYAASRARFFVGQTGVLEELDRHALGQGPPLVLTSLPGDGKSAILAAWTQRFRQQHPEVLLVAHFAGASSESGDVEQLAERILGRLKRACSIPLPVPEMRRQRLAALPSWLEIASRARRVVLVLDGLNQLSGPAADPLLSWLPRAFPQNVRLVLSCGPGGAYEELRRRGFPAVSPQLLQPDEAVAVARSYLGAFRKGLDPALERQIAAAGASFRRQGLRLLLEELRVFGVHEQVGERLTALLAAKEPPAQFLLFLQRLEQDFKETCPELVRRASCLLRASRTGLAEEELLELLGVPRVRWSQLRLALGELLLSRRGLLDFADAALRAAAGELSGGAAAEQEAHRQLADYFGSCAAAERRLQEYGHQLMAGAQWPRLQELLTDLRFLHDLWQADAPEVLRLWAALTEHTGLDLAQAYAPVLDSAEALAPYVDTLFDLFRQTGHAAAAGRVARLEMAGGGRASPRRLALAGVSYLEQGQPQEALPYLQQAADRTAAATGTSSLWTATAQVNLAAAQRQLGLTGEAQGLYEGALETLLREAGEDHPSTQEAIHGLGVLHYFRQDYPRALELFERSLAIQLRVKGSMDPETAVVRNDLGNTLGYLARHDAAAEQHRAALSIREALFGPRHPLVADSCFNLGNVLDLAGQRREALDLHSRALDIRVDLLGAEHPEVGRSQGMIGGLCQRWSRELDERLALRKNRREAAQVEQASAAFRQIGTALAEAGALAPAAEALGRALRLDEQLYGAGSPRLAAVLARLGELGLRARQPGQGLPHLRRAAELLRNALSEQDVATLAEVHELLGMACRDMGDLPAALNRFEACLTLRMRRFGWGHSSLGACYANIAGVHLRAGRFAEAERYTEEALKNAEATRGQYHPLTAAACGNHGTVLLRLGRGPEGLALLERSWQILRTARGEEHPLTRSALQFLRRAEGRLGGRA